MRNFLAGLLACMVVLCAGYAVASRNSSGTMSAANGPYIPGTTISSTAVNARFSDIENEITDSLSRSGKGSMTTPIKTPDGTVAAPAHSFTNEPGSGLYRIGASDYGFSVGGVIAHEWTSSAETTYTNLNATLSGTASTTFAQWYEASLADGNSVIAQIGKSNTSGGAGILTYTKNATAANSTWCMGVLGGSASTLCVDGNAKTTATGALASSSLAVTGGATVGTTLAVTGATTATGGLTIGSGGSAVVSFLVGSCTLNGATPALCQSTVQTTAKCICTYGSGATAHTVACAVGAGTLTAISATNGDVGTVNWACWN